MPVVLRDWARKYPRINISIYPSSSHGLYAKVLDGHLDAALLLHPLFELPKTCAWHGLRNEPLVLLEPASLRVADVLTTIPQEP